MRKFLTLILLCLFAHAGMAQLSDTLLRKAGFYISPAGSDVYYSYYRAPAPGPKTFDPRFAFSAGFRYSNKIGKGFFLEGGAGFSTYRSMVGPIDRMWTEYLGNNNYQLHHYKTLTETTEFYLNTPLLVGYNTGRGKVRFHGAAGISFNLRTWQRTETTVVEGPTPVYSFMNEPELQPKFGTGFFGIARAGISIPLTRRMSVDILPTARYRILYFSPGSMDVLQSIKADVSPWSVGLDIGLTFALDDKKPEIRYKEVIPDEGDYTLFYSDSLRQLPLRKQMEVDAYKNFIYIEMIGNGLVYTINYERTVFRKRFMGIQAKAGYGFFGKKYAFPVGMNVTMGGVHKKFEAGLGITLNNFSNGYFRDHAFGMTIDPCIAYRIERSNHFLLRLALMTHIVASSGTVLPGLGISMGGGF